MIKRLLLISLLTAVVVGCNAQAPGSSSNSQVQASDTKWCVTPKGSEQVCVQINEAVGKSAEEALKLADQKSDLIEVETQSFEYGALVTAVNGFSPDSKVEFWEFNVNGSQATVGISSYTVSAGDKLELTLAKIEI